MRIQLQIKDKIIINYAHNGKYNGVIYDILKLKDAEPKYSELLGYSFFENMNKEEIKQKKNKKVVIWSNNKDELIGWDYAKFVKNMAQLLKLK